MLVKTRAADGHGDLPQIRAGRKSAGAVFKLAELVRSGRMSRESAMEAARTIADIRERGLDRTHKAEQAPVQQARDVHTMWRRGG